MEPQLRRTAPNAALIRNTMLAEIILHVGDSPKARAQASRNLYVAMGSGSGEQFKPWLRLTDGSPLLAHSIVRGELDATFMNPSALLTQAYRGVGIFREALPVRVIASYPSWDRYVHAIHPRTGITSMQQLKAEKYPLRASVRADATHGTRYLIDQILALYDFTLDDIVSWGGSLQLVGPPSDPIRMEALRTGEIDAVFDEGMKSWLDAAMAAGLRPIAFEEPVLQQLETIGWRRAGIDAGGPFGRFPHLTEACVGIDYGGWPLYTRADLPEDDVYLICDALQARADAIEWEPGEYTGIPQLYQISEATPRDVPLHPGAERWCRDHGIAL